MMKIFYILMILVLVIASCKENQPEPPQLPEPTELYKKYRNSVVLIQNSYYFKTTLDNGFEFYYTMENNTPVFFDTEEEAVKKVGTKYGTGFFISDKGEIATNRHVIYPDKGEELVGEWLNNYFSDIKYKINVAINENLTEQSKIVELYNEYYEILDYERRNSLIAEHSIKKNEALEFEKILAELNFNSENTTTELKRVFLGIAYDDTHVTSINDFNECVAIKKASEDLIDLAIIQLKNKNTPTNVVNIFSLDNLLNFDSLKLNDNVYMIGFNHGISLASTSNGIKSQFTQGTITQDPDINRILYSIPTLPGSSGSPILDKWGNLVAINFAKTGDYQGFSFGIPAIALSSLYKSHSHIVTTDYSTTRPNLTTTETTLSVVNYENIIHDFLQAEENRDFEIIYSYFSPKFSRYYDINTPNYSKIKNRYEHFWSFISNARNTIKSIDKINDYTYDLYTNFQYYHLKKETEFSVDSRVRFLFDSNGKIVEVYGVE